MKVLIFHGYLLRGTGSNVYNASLARALARLGHEVHLLCQDRDARELGGEGPGSVTIHNPDIGGLLPVFVKDEYEGFEVKTFSELSDAELSAYIEANVSAVHEVIDAVGGVDAALANHLIMGPVILGRAELDYALKVHGSDLSYTVLPELERWRPYASQAIDGAAGVLVGSGHIADRLRQALGDAADPKVRLGPPGVDTELFAPVPADERAEGLRRLAASVREGHAGAWGRDPKRAAEAIEWFAESPGPRVVFVGKLIVSKGVDLLLAAWPLIRSQNPDARLLIAGFGELEPVLERAWAGLEAGDLDPLRELAARGRGMEGGYDHQLDFLEAFLGRMPESYARAASDAAGSVRFAGRLEHNEVGELVPAADALVFPSTFPEAFGMVAAEAASAGVLPVSAGHSGAVEVSRELAAELPEEVAPLVSFALDDRAVEAIAERVNAWLGLDEAVRAEAAESLRATVTRLWSWEGVAEGVLAAAAGRLDELPAVATA
ncbi:MAG TPA: glycosyltransferase family 4 protein [Solirubrobacterales bacterium]|nr:glycosyltransferase family 4 protein [Solirubrobacterales bacterium]